jgi:hypothetical protein
MQYSQQQARAFRRTAADRGSFFRCLLMALAIGLFPTTEARAQDVPASHYELYDLFSGVHLAQSDSTTGIAFEATVKAPGATWMRLLFSEIELGRASHISVYSVLDGDFIILDADAMRDYGNSSCFLNGDTLHLQLHVAPGDTGVFFRLSRLQVGDPVPISFTQCGAADNRVASNDNRVGRLLAVGCTAWRATNGCFMTAGHCTDFDPDDFPGGSGPLLPDGVVDLNGFVGFNIPQSTAAGNTVAAAAVDQYPIDLTNVTFRFDGTFQGLGKDWAVFGVNRNATTGLLPHEAYGLPMRITRDLPAVSTNFRITGCGLDNAQANQTLQTHTGPFNGESAGNVAADILLSYQIDTRGGNSGGPIIWNAGGGYSVGIHTNGGCQPVAPIGNNIGTSFEVNALETAIRNFTGATAVFCDVGHAVTVGGVCLCDGTVMRPFDSVLDGVNAVSSGGIVSIVAGTYTAANGNAFTTTKVQVWEAPCGTVVIGN